MKKFAFLLLIECALQAGVVSVNDQNFEKLILSSPVPVVLKLYTSTCGACQQMKTGFATASTLLTTYKFAELDTAKNSKVRTRYRIKTVPTLILFWQGQERARYSGAMSSAKIEQWLQSLVF